MPQEAPSKKRPRNGTREEDSPYASWDVLEGISHAAYDNILEDGRLPNPRVLAGRWSKVALMDEFSGKFQH